MDVSYYKTLVTSRGLLYQYFYRRPSVDTINPESSRDEPLLPTILLVHGFPTSSKIWRNQVAFFVEKGFPVMAPDLLAFGGSAKPVEPTAYLMNKVCRDLIDILDHEGVRENIVAVGHDM